MTESQEDKRSAFRNFTDERIKPYADEFDREEKLPDALIENLAGHGYLSSVIPCDFSGLGLDMVTFGLLNEEIGRGCSSVRSLITVHAMVSYAILRWGNLEQKNKWLPKLAKGEKIAAFALTEPNVGSDVRKIETEIQLESSAYVVTGRKKWTTFGQIADLFLIFGRCEGKIIAILLEKNSRGMKTKPIRGLLGIRASMGSDIELDRCEVPVENVLGGVGFGLSTVAMSALDLGRYSVAWGCVGIGQACLEACLDYARSRRQFGKPINRHQLIQEMIANMVTNVKAARLLCYNAGCLKEEGEQSSIAETLIAKYFSSTMVPRVASDAVQIHGGNGCGSHHPVQRYFRDAKVMEIIEGSSQMQQIMISQQAYVEFEKKRRNVEVEK